MEVGAQGFKKFVRRGITLEINLIARVDAALEVGAASESVAVTAEASLVNTSNGTVDASSAIDSMYGVRAYLRSTGEYVVTKNNVKGSSITVYRWTP